MISLIGRHRLLLDVVDQGICIGCGICAGVCTRNKIEMRWNEMGEINPYFNGDCGWKICDRVCIKSCPILYASADSHETIS